MKRTNHLNTVSCFMNRMANFGELCCDVPKWCEFVSRWSPAQRTKFQETGLQCMLDMPPSKIRSTLIRFMVEKYDPKTNKFNVQENHDGISAEGVDVECILGLSDEGLSIQAILYEEGDDASNNVPSHFLSSKSGNLVIEDLIADVIKSKVADGDFIHKFVLVLLGTVVAP